MHSRRYLISLGIALAALSAPSLANDLKFTNVSSGFPIIDLDYAQYRGFTNSSTNITSFLGIRYAASPIGSLRFQAPQAPTKVEGVQNATEFPNECIQSAGSGLASTNPLLPLLNRETVSTDPPPVSKRETIVPSEDCLFLDVTVPNVASASGLPVVVWIHGGGYVEGSASETPTDTDLTIDSHNQAITVLIQYRLGVFGFLAGPEVKKNGALNAGLLDQTFALQWIQKYISKFGGDPSKVTIWGESAGAGSVLQHIVANGGRTDPPLFRAALTSSTFLPSQYPGDGLIPTILYNQVANQTGCSNSSDSFSCLVALDADTLSSVNSQIITAGFAGTFTFVPVIDGELIVERPTVTLKKGLFNGDVLLSVTNTFEGRVFVQSTVTNTTDYAKELFPLLDAEHMKAVAAQYSVLNETLPTAFDQAVGIMGESIFICPTYFLLQAFKEKAWKGEFAIPPGDHGNDVPYYLTGYGPKYNNAEFIASFSGGFLDVVLSLDPNNKISSDNINPQWSQWYNSHTEMLFNVTTAGDPDIRVTPTDPGLVERCAFWESISEHTVQ